MTVSPDENEDRPRPPTSGERSAFVAQSASQTPVLPYLINGFGDRYLHDVNRGTFNQIGAVNEFKKRFGDVLQDNDCLTIIIGTDSGLLIDYVEDQGVPEGARIVFLELDALLPSIEAGRDGKDLDEQVSLLGQSTLADIIQDVSFTDYANIDAVRLVESLGAVDDFFGGYRDYFIAVKQELDSILWMHHVQLSNPAFVSRQLENLIEQHTPAQCLRAAFEGKTALLLGGGPSLDELLPWIKEHQNDVVIIAVSRICRRLHEAGVVPHLVVSIDPTDLSFDISKDFLNADSRIVLAHANHVAFPLLAQWRGRSIFLDRRYPWVCKGEQPNIAAAGPTVTNTAFALAEAMGFSTIVFAGVDLCHNAQGYSHARGSNEFDAGPMLSHANLRVTTNSGRIAETPPDFFNAIDVFSAQANQARSRGMRVINPSGDAAVMAGVDYIPVDEITIEPLPRHPFELLLAQLPDDSPAARCDSLDTIKRELARAHGRLRNIVRLAEDALACNEGLFGRRGKPADFAHKKRMDKIERQLNTKFSDLSEIVRMFSSQAFLRMPPSDREWTDDEIETAGETYYTAYRDNAQRIQSLIEAAQTRIDCAVDEESDTPDFEQLITQWDVDGIPGRARVWRHRHPALAGALDDATRARLDAMEQRFESILADRDTGHATKVRATAALAPLRAKLIMLFREGNADEITRIIDQIASQDSDEARQLTALGQGYQAELADDKDGAFAYYASLIDLAREQIDADGEDAANPRLEDALRRMVVIAMAAQWHDQALLLLQTLAGLSPAYEPQFAEMLRLTGQTEAAINVYTDYLSKAPDDHASMLRLGKLYQTIGATEAANTAFNYILENDPDNAAARSLLDAG